MLKGDWIVMGISGSFYTNGPVSCVVMNKNTQHILSAVTSKRTSFADMWAELADLCNRYEIDVIYIPENELFRYAVDEMQRHGFPIRTYAAHRLSLAMIHLIMALLNEEVKNPELAKLDRKRIESRLLPNMNGGFKYKLQHDEDDSMDVAAALAWYAIEQTGNYFIEWK